jgi:hypothetical protein
VAVAVQIIIVFLTQMDWVLLVAVMVEMELPLAMEKLVLLV